jgi:hypothetical protein
MYKVQKHNSFNTNTPSSESYKNDCMCVVCCMFYFTGGGRCLILVIEEDECSVEKRSPWFLIGDRPRHELSQISVCCVYF